MLQGCDRKQHCMNMDCCKAEIKNNIAWAIIITTLWSRTVLYERWFRRGCQFTTLHELSLSQGCGHETTLHQLLLWQGWKCTTLHQLVLWQRCEIEQRCNNTFFARLLKSCCDNIISLLQHVFTKTTLSTFLHNGGKRLIWWFIQRCRHLSRQC